ncbi:hypothetical protein HGRIS_009026 [Hohenbuehelia grisea]|uniref:Allergen n=1 Tax=Hohenbuehelia grisea TaxID=104357 RepID=A0ABR3J0B4_9AGAR
MGIATAVKDMFRSDSASSEDFDTTRTGNGSTIPDKNHKFPAGSGVGTLGKGTSARAQPANGNNSRAHNAVDFEQSGGTDLNVANRHDANDYKLPAGTGPGTLGKGVSARANGRRQEGAFGSNGAKGTSDHSTISVGIPVAAAAGVGTAAAANHSARSHDRDLEGNRLTSDEKDIGINGKLRAHGHDLAPKGGMNNALSAGEARQQGVTHNAGHVGLDSPDIMPSGNVTEHHNHLQHVTRDNVRHVETEEVLRQKEHDRHVHHVQHHVQPVHVREERDEVHHQNVVPVTHVKEHHASKEEDTSALRGLVTKHQDSVTHAPKERTIIDKGEVVNENVHHHVHHVVQPVIEKETIDRHRIHTVIPTHHVTHEAPIVHQSHVHKPITMDEFLKNGTLEGGIAHDQLADRVLNNGNCTREVDGMGEKLSKHLKLGSSTSQRMDAKAFDAKRPSQAEKAGLMDEAERSHVRPCKSGSLDEQRVSERPVGPNSSTLV